MGFTTLGRPLDLYRVRRGWLGRAILQRQFECREMVKAGFGYQPSAPVLEWRDVPFDQAPMLLKAEINNNALNWPDKIEQRLDALEKSFAAVIVKRNRWD